MAQCTECGKKLGLFEAGSGDLCSRCVLSFEGQHILEEAVEIIQENRERNADIEAIMLTAETYPEGLKIA